MESKQQRIKRGRTPSLTPEKINETELKDNENQIKGSVLFNAEAKLERMSKLSLLMNITRLSKCRSDDELTSNGCVITDRNLILLGVGYNADARKSTDVNNASTIMLRFDKPIDTIDIPDGNMDHFMRNGMMTVAFHKKGLVSESSKRTIIHAETNAILFSRCMHNDFNEGVCFVTQIPCVNCMKLLVQKNIKVIIYEKDKGKDSDTWRLAIENNVILINWYMLCEMFNFADYDLVVNRLELRNSIGVSIKMNPEIRFLDCNNNENFEYDKVEVRYDRSSIVQALKLKVV